MNELIEREEVSKIASFNSIDVFSIKTEKFKTNAIHIFFNDNLSEENVTKNALVPAVLRRGTENHPTFKDLALYLEQLYGASFDCGVVKKGEQQIINFYIEYISDRFVQKDENISEKAVDLLIEILTRPVLENGLFKPAYVEQEKENLKDRIEGRINDKVQYAVERCLEELCKGEPYELYEYGKVEHLPNITPEELYRRYIYIIETLPMRVFISGDSSDGVIEGIVNKLKQFPRGEIKKVEIPKAKKQPETIREITDRMNVNQGKLSLGFRTNIMADDDNYYALAVYNGILGGGIHSKLFQNVREKASLAYYAFSRLDKFKGLMVISSGIEIANKNKAIDIIREQMEDIKKGNITDYEFDSTLKSFETTLKSIADSHTGMVDFYLSQVLYSTGDTPASFINKIKSVKKEDVIRVSNMIEPGVVYFLTSME